MYKIYREGGQNMAQEQKNLRWLLSPHVDLSISLLVLRGLPGLG